MRVIAYLSFFLFPFACLAQQKPVLQNRLNKKVANPDFVTLTKKAISDKYGEDLAILSMTNDFFNIERLWFEKANTFEIAGQQQCSIMACYSLKYIKDWSDQKNAGFIEKGKAKILLVFYENAEWKAVNVDIL